MKKHRILVVEDDLHFAWLICHILRKPKYGGHEMQCCDSAERGLRLLQTEPFDLLITDFILPDLNGQDFLEKAHVYIGNIPVIMMTAYSIYLIQEKVNGLVNVLLSKPFRLADLVEGVKRLLGMQDKEGIDAQIAHFDH